MSYHAAQQKQKGESKGLKVLRPNQRRHAILILFNLSYMSCAESNFRKMCSNAFSSRTIFLFLDLLILSNRTSFAQSITAITQAPGFSSLSSCAQGVAKAVIDDSTSPECPAGSPPSCFCGNEGLSKEWSDQISTNVLNNCLTSSGPQATSAASVFAAYCSAGEGAAAASTTTTDAGSISTATAKQSTSTTAQNQATSTTKASPTASSQTSIDLSSTATVAPSGTGAVSSGGLDTSDKIAIGIGVPVGVATILGAWYTWRTWRHPEGRKTRTRHR